MGPLSRTPADSHTRTHIVRVCREECSERGFSGEAFYSCVEECVKEKLSSLETQT